MNWLVLFMPGIRTADIIRRDKKKEPLLSQRLFLLRKELEKGRGRFCMTSKEDLLRTSISHATTCVKLH